MHPLRGQTPHQAPETMAQAVDELAEQGAEAFAFFSIYDYGPNHFAEQVMNAVDIERVPAVLISWDDLRAPVPHVFYDNHYAGYQAAQHLLQNGCEQLIFFAPFDAVWARQRIVGARLAVSAAGLGPEVLTEYPSGTLPVQFAEDNEPVIEAFARELMAAPGKKSPRVGVIAAHDDLAHRLLDKAQGKRRKMGRDFAVVGFDDAPRSRVLGLTSLRPPLEDLGAEAARLLLQRLRGNVTSTQVRLCSHLVPRLST
jgi:LacI family transcriptional regulator